MLPLSEQIGDFRHSFGRYLDDGVALCPEAVKALDGLFAAFQAQAKMLEGGAPAPNLLETLCGALKAETIAVEAVAAKLGAANARLRSADVLPFPAGRRA